MQTKLPLISSQPAPRKAPASVLAQVCSESQAVAISLAGIKAAAIAAQLHISAPYLSLIRRGKRPMPPRLVDAFCEATGTALLRQWLTLQDALREVATQEETNRALARILRSA